MWQKRPIRGQDLKMQHKQCTYISYYRFNKYALLDGGRVKQGRGASQDLKKKMKKKISTIFFEKKSRIRSGRCKCRCTAEGWDTLILAHISRTRIFLDIPFSLVVSKHNALSFKSICRKSNVTSFWVMSPKSRTRFFLYMQFSHNCQEQ